MENQQLIELTADIVSAHVSNNSVAVGDLPLLVQQIHGALSDLATEKEEEPAKTPAVAVRSSVKPDYVVCLECGAKQKMLRRHLQTAHGMSPEEYRAAYDLKTDYPLVAPNYAEQRRALAKKIGLGRKPRSASANSSGSSGAAKASSAKKPATRRKAAPKKKPATAS